MMNFEVFVWMQGVKHGEFDEALRFLREDPAGPPHQRCGLLLFNDALAQ